MTNSENFHDEQMHRGYSLEDKYFHDLEVQRLANRHPTGTAMHCPQCGANHQPIRFMGSDATKCEECHGIFLTEEQAKRATDYPRI